MRIISGKHRGRVLAEFLAENIRPTSDRAKEALFNILSDKIYSADVLDLFCGSGNLGIEAISRGAKSVTFNDISKDSIKILEKNLLKINEKAIIFNYDYQNFLKTTQNTYDIIFIDPPYKFDFGLTSLTEIAKRKLLKDDGVAIYERDIPFSGEAIGLELFDERKYGKAYLSFFRYKKEN